MLEEVLVIFLTTIVAVTIGSTISARLIRRGMAKDTEKALRLIIGEIIEREDVKKLINSGAETFVVVKGFLEGEELRNTLESLRKALDKL